MKIQWNFTRLLCGRKSDRLKAIYFDGDGFVLLYKRLEGKGRFHWPRTTQEVQELTEQQYRWLIEGLTIEQKCAIEKSGSPLNSRFHSINEIAYAKNRAK